MQQAERNKIAQFILLMFITGIFLYLCWLMLEPFILILLWSVILVIIFYPVYKKIHSKTRNHPVSAIITILISFLTFIIPLTLVSAAAINELSGFTGAAVKEIELIMKDPMNSSFGKFYHTINSYVNIEAILNPESIKAYSAKISEKLLDVSVYFVEGFFAFFIGILIAVFSMYYLFRDGEKIRNDLPKILPVENEHAKLLITETSDLISATIRGTIFVAVIQGTLAGIIFWLLGIPSSVLLGLLAMLFSLVPMGGTAFVTVPVIISLLISGDYTKAAILAIYASTVIGLVDNFLLPKLVKDRANMNELYVFFSVVGGIQLFGIIGIFMGPIILAISIGLLNVLKGKKIDKETISLQ